MIPTKNDLPQPTRETVAQLLSERLVESIDLGLRAKQAHWNVRGPRFKELHELFDETAGEAAEWADELAERAVQLGAVVDGTVRAVATRSKLPAFPAETANESELCAALTDSVAEVGKRFRAAIDAADAAGDKGTSDLFTGLSRAADKRLWMLEAHLQR